MAVYQGIETFPSYREAGFGFGESAVLHLTEGLGPGTIVYCNRYFSTVKLATERFHEALFGYINEKPNTRRCSGLAKI